MRPLNDPYDRQDSQEPEDRPRKLGSLAQSARGKQLNQIRVLLIVVGVIVIGRSIYDVVKLNEIKFGAPDFIDMLIALCYGFIGIGVLFCVFAAFVHNAPVAIAIISLVLFVAMELIIAVVTNFESLKVGWLLRILAPVGLIQAIQTGVAYEKERAAERSADYE
jgi:predicted neutral ceramidase superfamily lipid hydrolase